MPTGESCLYPAALALILVYQMQDHVAANECGAPPAGTTVVSNQPEPAVTQKFDIAHEPRIQPPARRPLMASEFVLYILNSSV